MLAGHVFFQKNWYTASGRVELESHAGETAAASERRRPWRPVT